MASPTTRERAAQPTETAERLAELFQRRGLSLALPGILYQRAVHERHHQRAGSGYLLGATVTYANEAPWRLVPGCVGSSAPFRPRRLRRWREPPPVSSPPTTALESRSWPGRTRKKGMSEASCSPPRTQQAAVRKLDCVGNRREIKAQTVEQPMELVLEVLHTKCGAAASHAGNDGPDELIRICERTVWGLGDFRHQQSIGSLDGGEPMFIKYKPRHRVGRWFQAITAESPAPQMPTPIPPMTDVPPPPTIPGTMPPTIDPPEPPFVPTPPPPRVDPPPPPFVPTPAPPRVDPPPPPTVPGFVQRLFGEPDEPPPAA